MFTDSPFVMLQAEEHHRDHAIIEQVFADWTDGPSPTAIRLVPANASWVACAAISHNLLRAAGALASLACAKAKGATLRRDLIGAAARIARPGRRITKITFCGQWPRKRSPIIQAVDRG